LGDLGCHQTVRRSETPTRVRARTLGAVAAAPHAVAFAAADAGTAAVAVAKVGAVRRHRRGQHGERPGAHRRKPSAGQAVRRNVGENSRVARPESYGRRTGASRACLGRCVDVGMARCRDLDIAALTTLQVPK